MPISINCILCLIREGNLNKHEQLYSETAYVPERNKCAKQKTETAQQRKTRYCFKLVASCHAQIARKSMNTSLPSLVDAVQITRKSQRIRLHFDGKIFDSLN